MIIPDVSSVNYGRTVGYTVREIKVNPDIASISGTKCREMIKNNNPDWKKYVAPEIRAFLENKYTEDK